MNSPTTQPQESSFVPQESMLIPENIDISSASEKGDFILGEDRQLTRFPHLENGLWYLDTLYITPNPEQPRSYFDPEKMEELKQTISKQGQKDPIHVVPYVDEHQRVRFFIVDGERRYRTISNLNLDHAKVIVDWYASKREIFKTSLILNISKADHNPIELANAYEAMVNFEVEDGMGRTQAIQEVANSVGKSQATITNLLRLLTLDPSIQQLVITGELPKSNALQISSAKLKFGDQLQEAQVARILLDNLDKQFESESNEENDSSEKEVEKPKKTITRNNVKDALQKALVLGGEVSEEEALLIEHGSNVINFVTSLSRLRRDAAKLVGKEDDYRQYIELIRDRRGQPPEVLEEKMKDLLDILRLVYQSILKPAITPAAAETPEEHNTFVELLEGYYQNKESEVRYDIAEKLAYLADEDAGKLYTAQEIAGMLDEYYEDMNTQFVASNMPYLIREIEQYGLTIESHQVRRRRGSNEELEKLTGYRMARLDSSSE